MTNLILKLVVLFSIGCFAVPLGVCTGRIPMGDYEICTCKSLRKKLRKRKASTAGIKADLITRLYMLDEAENIKIVSVKIVRMFV